MPSTPSTPLRRAPRRALVVFAGGAAVLLALGAVTEEMRLRRERAELVGLVGELGVTRPELLREVGHSGDGARARIAVAGALLAAELEPSESAADPELSRRRLDAARRLASSALDERPASWRAATVTGAATYLAWSGTGSVDRDPRLLQEYRRWEEPLLLARRLAPARDEPVRVLVGAYLELWPALSADKRRLARELAGRALSDRRTFDRLIEPWLRVAGTGPEALAALPDEPWAWNRVATILAGRADWSGFCDAWGRRHGALERSLRTRLDEGRSLLDRGQVLAARSTLLGLAATAPPDARFAAVVDAALTHAPPGPPGPDLVPALRSWLSWQLAPTRAGGDGLSRAALDRLRAAAFPGTLGTDDLPLAARAALALDDPRAIRRAERIEQRADDLWSESWALYFVDKAAALDRAGRTEAALATLDRVHPAWRRHPIFLEVAAKLARAEKTERAATVAGQVEQPELPEPRARRWPGTAWSWERTTPSLTLLAAEAADGLLVAVADASPTGAAVELRLDGRGVGCRVAAIGGSLTLDAPVTAGPHTLELVTLAGERVWPGPVELVVDSYPD